MRSTAGNTVTPGRASTRPGVWLTDASLVLMAVIGTMRGTDTVNRKGVIGILLSIAGIAFVVFGTTSTTGGEGGSTASRTGDLLVLGGSLCWAIYSVALKPY